MPQQLLLETTGQEGFALQINGRFVIASHEQLSAIIKSRLGQNHADFLALPGGQAQTAQPQGNTRWSTHLAGDVKPASQLDASELAKLERTAQRLTGDIRGLAAQMQAEGPATQLVGQMLEHCIQVPPAGNRGSWLFSVGGKPVTVLWGHSGTALASAAGMPAVSSATGLATTSGLASSSSAPNLTEPNAFSQNGSAQPGYIDVQARAVQSEQPDDKVKKPWLRWLAWLALVLLLLALLMFGLQSCLGRLPDLQGSTHALAEAAQQNKLLEDEIAKKKSELTRYECVPEAPKPPESALPLDAPKPAASEPDKPAPLPLAEDPKPAASAPKPAASAPKPVAPKPEPAASNPKPPASKPLPPVAQAKCKPASPGDEPEVWMIVDASGSMNAPFGGAGTRLDAAKRASDVMIRSLPSDVAVGLVDFAACGQVRRDKLYASGERGALIGSINGLAPKGGTPLAAAIRRTGAVITDSAEGVIVIVSDGDDSCGGDPCAEARALKAQRPKVVINVIDLSDNPKDKLVLQCVANAGGGRLLSPGDPVDLNRKLKEAVTTVACTKP